MKRIISWMLSMLLISGMVMAQQKITVTGTVVDAQGQPLAGATVLEKGSSNVVVADMNGRFTISVSSSAALLQFSYFGFIRVEKSASTINPSVPVSMQEDNLVLDEVVVIGYGQVRKGDLT
ncbi:MAG: carboxypeptidase-like regulatory domain-containing protein, partial [Bacteroidetes bacterium]|nr:carboxypeptidase-like regulatory domain-containing protein [Bacteroidota bacterium]